MVQVTKDENFLCDRRDGNIEFAVSERGYKDSISHSERAQKLFGEKYEVLTPEQCVQHKPML
jgi:hypothetical protein